MSQPCIICYKLLSSSPLSDKNVGDGHFVPGRMGPDRLNLFFKLLGRYVDFDGDDKPANYDDGEGEASKSLIENAINIGLLSSCVDCSKIVESFCDLYHELKSIELFIHWKVWTLKSIMISAQRVPSRLKEFREVVGNAKQVNIGGGMVLAPDEIIDFKKNLVKKCRQRVGAPIPRLIIKRNDSQRNGTDSVNLPDPVVAKQPLLNDIENAVSVTVVGIHKVNDGSNNAAIASDMVIEGRNRGQDQQQALNELPTSDAGPVTMSSLSSATTTSNNNQTEDNFGGYNKIEDTGPENDDDGVSIMSADMDDDELLIDVETVSPSQDPLGLEAESFPELQDSEEAVGSASEPILSKVLVRDLKTEIEEAPQGAEVVGTAMSKTVREGPRHFRDRYPCTEIRYKCPLHCKGMYSRKTELRAHLRTKHGDNKRWKQLAEQAQPIRFDQPIRRLVGLRPVRHVPQKNMAQSRSKMQTGVGQDIKADPGENEVDAPSTIDDPDRVSTDPVALAGPSKSSQGPAKQLKSNRGQFRDGLEDEQPHPHHDDIRDDEPNQTPKSRLRRVHRCTKCMKTFSTPGRLRDHGKSGECAHGVLLTDSDDESETEYYNDTEGGDKEHDWEGDANDDDDDDDMGEGETPRRKEEIPFVIITNPNSSLVGEPQFSINSDTKKHQCSICSKQFKNIACFQSHWKVAHVQVRYQCKLCPQIFRRRDNCILHHRRIHLGAKLDGCGKSCGGTKYMYRCPESECGQHYSRLHQLLLHRKESHLPPSDESQIYVDLLKNGEEFIKLHVPVTLFICPMGSCQQPPFYYDKDLDDHSKLHGTFHCQFCEVTKSFALDLAEHELEHGRPKVAGSGWGCPRCKAKCWSKNNYIAHHLEVHQSLTVAGERCAICRQHEYHLNMNLIRHYKLSHNLKDRDNDSIHRCGVPGCPTYFRASQNITHHHKEVHQFGATQLKELKLKRWRKSFKCRDCDDRFSRRETLQQHRLRVHVPSSEHQHCPHCKYVCESKIILDQHIRSWHPKGAKKEKECPKCSKVFDIRYLANHLRSHKRKEDIEAGLLDPRPARKHVCEICGKAFKERYPLDIHKLSHSGPDTWEFMCGLCSKKCMTQQKLDEHMRTHSQEKPFVCEICGVKYAHRHNLRNHVNSKHGHGDGDAKMDPTRKYEKVNLTSRKGIKKKKQSGNEDKVETDEKESD